VAVARADDVQHLDAGLAQPSGGAEHRAVDRAGSLRPAGHQQHGQVGAKAEVGACLVTDPQPVKPGDLAPDRDADVGAVPELGIRMAGEDMRGEPGTDPVGESRLGIRLVHDDRDPAAPGGQVGRGRHVPAEADERLCSGAVERGGGRVDRSGQPAGDGEQLRRHRPGHRHRGDELQWVPAQRDQPGLQAAFGPQAGDLGVGVDASQRIRQR
jgi:hypothetical protein